MSRAAAHGSLALVNRILPPMWDGWRVEWHPFEVPSIVVLCPPPTDRRRCECGSEAQPMVSHGWRQPQPGETFESTKPKLGRFGRTVHVPVRVPAWPVVDLILMRCPGCGADEVWDRRTDEWWTLDAEDYGPNGSVRPEQGNEIEGDVPDE